MPPFPKTHAPGSVKMSVTELRRRQALRRKAAAPKTPSQKQFHALKLAHAANPLHTETTRVGVCTSTDSNPFNILTTFALAKEGQEIRYMGYKFRSIQHALAFSRYIENPEVGARVDEFHKSHYYGSMLRQAADLTIDGDIKDPREAMEFGGAPSILNWERDVMMRVLEKLLAERARTCPEFCKVLKMTGRGTLQFSFGGERSWGCSPEWKLAEMPGAHGKNIYGVMMMVLRGRLFPELWRDELGDYHSQRK